MRLTINEQPLPLAKTSVCKGTILARVWVIANNTCSLARCVDCVRCISTLLPDVDRYNLLRIFVHYSCSNITECMCHRYTTNMCEYFLSFISLYRSCTHFASFFVGSRSASISPNNACADRYYCCPLHLQSRISFWSDRTSWNIHLSYLRGSSSECYVDVFQSSRYVFVGSSTCIFSWLYFPQSRV